VSVPSFSIIIPTFQRRDVVCDAVRAIAQVEYAGPLELLVVVDGSTDGSAEALAAIPCPFPIRIIVQENAGLAATRNRGAAAAGGEILLFLDDDMICQRDIVAQHASSHANGADAVLGHIPLDPASPPGLLAEGVGKWAEARAAALSAGAPLSLFDLLGGHLSAYQKRGGCRCVGPWPRDRREHRSQNLHPSFARLGQRCFDNLLADAGDLPLRVAVGAALAKFPVDAEVPAESVGQQGVVVR